MTATRRVVFGFSLALAAACGGDDTPGDGDDDGGGAADAAVAIDADTTPDAAPVPVDCGPIRTLYGDLGAVTGEAVYQPQDPDEPAGLQYLSLQIPLNEESPPDVLFVELWEGAAPYSPDLAAGPVTIVQDQADVIQCGACVFIAGDFVDASTIDFYMARSGSIAIDEVDPTPGTGRLRGTLSDIDVRQVRIEPGIGQVVVDGGCEANVGSVSFDATVVAPPSAQLIAPRPRRDVVERLR